MHDATSSGSSEDEVPSFAKMIRCLTPLSHFEFWPISHTNRRQLSMLAKFCDAYDWTKHAVRAIRPRETLLAHSEAAEAKANAIMVNHNVRI